MTTDTLNPPLALADSRPAARSASSAPERVPREHTFTTHDGTTLFYREWPAAPGAQGKRALVLLHRGHEHSGRLQHVVDGLDLPGYTVFAWDARGHGRSPGERGYAEHFGVLVKDLDAFVRHLGAAHGIANDDLAVVAQSVGAVIAATWVHDYAPAIRALVLASPAFKVKLYVPLARPALSVLMRFRDRAFVNSYVKAKFLTHDPVRQASYESDPLITRAIAVNVLLGLYETAERLIADAGAIRVPLQLLISAADWVVHQAPQQAFFARVGSAVKECHVLPGFYHDTLGEREAHVPLKLARTFIEDRFSESPARRSLVDADQTGYTADEFRRLAAPVHGLAAAYWALNRQSLATVGRLSEGIRIATDTGFDSGSTLDYVYENRTRGRWGVGRLFDRAFLDSIGWRGIRVRKQHLERLIGVALGRLAAAGAPARVVDIAAGHGRYVLDALEGAAGKAPVEVLLRDYSEINVAAGRASIAARQLQARGIHARFEAGDAFDEAGLAALTPQPTLAIVSGLYELFPENAPLQRSLAGLARAVPSGGFLIYTNQPWHPQLELIARSLTSHRGGSRWVMRRRTQEEMDELVVRAGFRKVDQLTDRWGIFTVSLAERV